jgi:hypothetical protein
MIRVVLLCMAISVDVLGYGQQKITDVSIPTSPASSVLGLQASEILAPKSFKALETALYSNFVDGNNNAIIPNDFALEFQPYWAANHGLSLREFLFPKKKAMHLWRNSAISLASTQNLVLGDGSASNGMGMGYRTSMFWPSEEDRKAIDTYWGNLKDAQTVVAGFGAAIDGAVTNGEITSREQCIRFIKAELPGKISAVYADYSEEKIEAIIDNIISELGLGRMPEFDVNNTDVFMDRFNSILDDALKGEEAFEVFEDYIKERNGLSLDIAIATFINFPTNDFEFSYTPRRSFWLTPTYRFDNKLDFLKVMVVIRKDWYDLDYYRKYYSGVQYFKDNTDYGIGVMLDFKKFLLHGEAVGRSSYTEIEAGEDLEGNKLYRKETKSSFQYVLNFSYKVSTQLAISYTLGNKFNLGTSGNSLISLLSLNLGFGDPPVVSGK